MAKEGADRRSGKKAAGAGPRRRPAATARLALRGGRRPQLCKPSERYWTEEQKETYLATLEETCNISASLRAVAKSNSGLRRLRDRDGAFRARERRAIAAAHLRLQLFALEKMMTGTVRTTTRPDGGVTTVHEYPLHLAIQLLRLHRETAIEVAAELDLDQSEVDETVKKLLRRIVRVEERDSRIRAAGGGAKAGGDGAEAARLGDAAKPTGTDAAELPAGGAAGEDRPAGPEDGAGGGPDPRC